MIRSLPQRKPHRVEIIGSGTDDWINKEELANTIT